MEEKTSKISKEFYNSNNTRFKLENLNTLLIRSQKKSISCLAKGSFPTKSLIPSENLTKNQLNFKHELENLFYKNKNHFIDHSNSFKFGKQEEFKSANKEFLSCFYSDSLMRRFYLISINLSFCDCSDSSIFCKMFNMKCCLESCHSGKCLEKWENLRFFLLYNYLNGFSTVEKKYRANDIQDIQVSIEFVENFENGCQHCSNLNERSMNESTYFETTQDNRIELFDESELDRID